jgi:hypothetical protein
VKIRELSLNGVQWVSFLSTHLCTRPLYHVLARHHNTLFFTLNKWNFVSGNFERKGQSRMHIIRTVGSQWHLGHTHAVMFYTVYVDAIMKSVFTEIYHGAAEPHSSTEHGVADIDHLEQN